MSPFTKTAAAVTLAGAMVLAAAAPSEARGGRWAAAGIGFAAGALIGAAAANAAASSYYAPGYYGGGYGYGGYYGGPYAYEPAPVYAAPVYAAPVYADPVYVGPGYYGGGYGYSTTNRRSSGGTTWVPGTNSPRVNIQ